MSYFRIVVYEGALTKVRSIIFKGNIAVTPSKTLLNVLKLTPGEPLNLSLLESGFDSIREYYLQNGYLGYEDTQSKQSYHLL